MRLNFPGGKELRLIVGDITKFRVDAIVNATNSELIAGGGVDGAIHRVGGPTLQRELNQIRKDSGPCPPGNAVVTGAGALPAQYVFHAVGPIYKDGKQGEPVQLASCYRRCLELGAERALRTISFPAISTGAYGYPADEAAKIAIETVSAYLSANEDGMREVLFVLFDQVSFDAVARVLSSVTAR